MHNFRKILKTVGIFLLMVVLLSVGFGALYFGGEAYQYQDAREREELSGRVTVLGCGASYMMFGFQPELFDEGYPGLSYNLSGIRLPMNGRRELIRLELERNPIQTVLLEVSSDTLTRTDEGDGVEGDLLVLGRLTGSERLRYFFESFSISEYPAVYYDVVSRGIENAGALLCGAYKTSNDTLIRGYYTNLDKDYISYWYTSYYHTESLDETVQEEDVEGLREIAALCREHGAELILVDLPKSEFYNSKYDNHQFFHDWYTAFAAEEGISYYDFNLYRKKGPLLPDTECFSDETHMMDEGARRFTAYLAEFLTRRAAGEDVSKDFFLDFRRRDQTWGYLEKDSISKAK